MKKQCLYFLQLAAFALVIVLAACSNPADTPPGKPTPPFSISGKFTNGSKTSYFTAQEGSGTVAASIQRAVTRAASATEAPLSGTLDDGDITFRLKGFYDKESGAYTLQAASSVIKYSINGTASGSTTASVATRSNANEPFGNLVYIEDVTTEITGDELAGNITRGDDDYDVATGFDQEDCWGVWYDEAGYGQIKYVVNEWGVTVMTKKDGEWQEEMTLGFSKITPNGDDITVIGDARMANYTPVGYTSEEFAAYAKSKGLEVFDVNNTPFPGTDSIFLDSTRQQQFQHEINGDFPFGAQVKGTGRYVVEIRYAPEGIFSGGTSPQLGTPEKPFIVERVIQEGQQEDLVSAYAYNGDAISAATLEGALDAALDAIKTKATDSAAKYDPELPWTFTTAGMDMSFAVEEWEEEHPQPSSGDALTAWFVDHEAFLKAQLLARFSTRFPDAEKLIMPNSDEYLVLLNQFNDEPGRWIVEYVTKYYKWNIVEANGRLIVTPYSTDETLENSYVETYAQADAFSQPQLMDAPLATLSR